MSKLATFQMAEYELIAPAVRNDGTVSHYAAALRAGLQAVGISGWTETASAGYWQGKLELGTRFTVYAGASTGLGVLCDAARAAMPDQEAVQVVRKPGMVTLAEA